VEVALIRRLQAELTSKKKRLMGMEKKDTDASCPSRQSTVPVLSFRKKRRQQIEETTEQRTVLMVVLNALINFFFRIPELLLPISVAQDIFYLSFVCIFTSFSAFLTDLAFLFYILTFSTNFLVYYLFNMKFKQSFSEFTHAKKRL
jgi:hypothetical protein